MTCKTIHAIFGSLPLLLGLMASPALAASYSVDLSAEWFAGPANYLGVTPLPEPTTGGGPTGSNGSVSADATFTPEGSSVKSVSVEAQASIAGGPASNRFFSISGILVEPEYVGQVGLGTDNSDWYHAFIRLNYGGVLSLSSEWRTWAGARLDFDIIDDGTGEPMKYVRREPAAFPGFPDTETILDASFSRSGGCSCGLDYTDTFAFDEMIEILSETSFTKSLTLSGSVSGGTGTLEECAPIPLPASLPLLLSVLGGLASVPALRARRRSQSG